MENQIELEYIGKISVEKREELKKIFENQGDLKEEKERISFMYFRDSIPKDLSEIKDEEIDLRLRITNKKPELMLKKGLFTGTHIRKEVSLVFPKEEINQYVDFLSILGWNIGVIYAATTKVYNYKGVEFSLVEIDGYGDNFEAEIITSKGEEENSRNIIHSVLKELGLEAFSESDLNKQCNDINNKGGLQFDFSKQDFNELKEKFSKYF